MSPRTVRVVACWLVAFGWLLPTVAAAQRDNAPWPMYRADAGATGAGTSLGPAAARTIAVLAARPRSGPVVGAGNTLFLVPSTGPALRPGGPLVALRPHPEEVIWETRVDTEALALALWGDTLYVVGRRGALFALGAADGAVVSQAAYAGEGGRGHRVYPPVVDERGALFLSTEARVEAFAAGLTRQLWAWESPITDEAGFLYLGPPVLGPAGMLLVAHSRGSMFALAASTGELAWEFSTNAMSLTESAPLAASSGSILWVASTAPYERKLHCLAGDGRLRWSVSLPEALPSGIAVHDARVVYLSRAGHLVCFSERDGSPLWAEDLVPAVPSNVAFQAPPVVDAGGSLFVASGSHVLCHDITSGEQLWDADLGGDSAPESLMLGSDGWLFATSPNGVYAIAGTP